MSEDDASSARKVAGSCAHPLSCNISVADSGGNGAADLAEVQPLDLLLPFTVKGGVVSSSFFSFL